MRMPRVHAGMETNPIVESGRATTLHTATADRGSRQPRAASTASDLRVGTWGVFWLTPAWRAESV